jgi:hypothetical protein
MDKTKVLIAIPTTDSQVTNEIADLCEAALLMSCHEKSPWTFQTRRLNGKRTVEHARNCLAGEFLASEADVLWFIDQDTRPSANSFELLLLLERYDIVGGVYPAFQYHGPDRMPSLTFGVYHKDGDGWQCDPMPDEGNPIVTCDAVMMGATLIKRAVLEDSRMLLDTVEDPLAPPLFRTERGSNGDELATEDVDFCERAGALGYRVGCHTGVKWGHRKKLDLLTVARMMIGAYQKGIEAQQEIPRIVVAR